MKLSTILLKASSGSEALLVGLCVGLVMAVLMMVFGFVKDKVGSLSQPTRDVDRSEDENDRIG